MELKLPRIVSVSLFMLLLSGLQLSSFDVVPIHQAQTSSPTVYYKEDGTNIDVYNPNLRVRIVKTRANWQQGGRITIVEYKGSGNLVSDEPLFGALLVWNTTTKIQKYPNTMTVSSSTGNNTGKLTIILTTSTVVDYNNLNPLPINVIIKYTFYSDFDGVFIRVTLDSTLTDWLLRSSMYGTSLKFKYFSNYNATGLSYLGPSKTGTLTKSSMDVIPDSIRYNIITIKNVTNNIAVTMFPTTISATAGSLKDRTDGTWMYLTTLHTRTSADVWVEHGRYIRDFTYGCGWLFHDADKSPYVVTPWLMPNAAPYGIMHTYDEIPWDNYDKVSPSPDTPITSRWWEWLDQNAKRRVNLLILLDYLVGNYTPTAEGIDKSWTVHGTKRMANTSTEYKEWLKGLEGKRIGFGIHGYHHDYPWQWEFRSVTNTTWIDLTWNQLYQDFKILGLSNSSLLHFKAAGFRMQPHGLEILTKYGVKILHVAFERGCEPLYQVYVDSYGRKLILVIAGLNPDGELAGGKEVSYVSNALRSSLTNFGLVNLAGHFLKNDTLYNDFNSVFTQVETYFEDNLDYFLVEEISNYWHEVLLPLEYTYNTTTIEKTTNDSRLTFKLINPPYSINKGLVYNSSSFILYAPNVQTLDFLFTRLSGYAQLSNMVFSANKMSFLLNAPSETTSTTKVYCADKGKPRGVYATNGSLTWGYDASTTILTLSVVHDGPTNISVDWRIPGDVNGDGIVDASDLSDLSKTYGSKSGDPNWDLDCDFTRDDKIDVLDLFDLGKNYGKRKT